MMAAAALMALLYIGMTRIVGELAAACPDVSGFDGYVGRGLSHAAGAVAGMTLFGGLAIGTGLAASFAAAYAQSLFGIGGWGVKVLLIGLVTAVLLRGARDSIRVTLVAGSIAMIVLLGFCAAMLPQFTAAHLLTSVRSGPATLWPSGIAGIFACVPFALFFFMGVEQAALGAAEARNVTRTVPLALTIAIATALAIGFGVLVLSTGAAGVAALAGTDDPLYAAASSNGKAGPVGAALIGGGAIVSLMATFFSLAYAASRQAHALAGAGDLPAWQSRINGRQAPHWALVTTGIIGAAAAAFDPSIVMVVFVFLLNVTYQFTILAFVALRRREPKLARPFRVTGGEAIAALSSALSLVVLASCIQLHALITSCALIAIALYALLRRLLHRACAAPG